MPKESKKSESLTDKLKDKGDVELSIEEERTAEHVAIYHLVAKYDGGEEKEMLFSQMPSIGFGTSSDPITSRLIYSGILGNLGVEPGSLTVDEFETFVQNLHAALTRLSGEGIPVRKVGGYDSPEAFKAAYAMVSSDHGKSSPES